MTTGPGVRGSSPLARGLHLPELHYFWDEGIIPARAGFTGVDMRLAALRADHPRSRGVYKTHDAQHRKSPGSSPLARGLQGADHAAPVENRIIPARAGFTTTSGRRWPGGWDHPRSRGVYLLVVGGDRARQGSSPLARGLRPRERTSRGSGRIIPARAGFTRPRSGRRS